MINTRHYAIVAVLLLALAGCRSHDARVGSDTPAANASTTADATPAAPLAVSSVSRRLTAPGCQPNPDGCSSVEADYLRFDDSEALSQAVLSRLLRMAGPISDAPADERTLPDSLDAFADDLFAQSRQANAGEATPRPWQTVLQAETLDRHDDLLTLELNAWTYSGGAHGMPVTAFMVIDERSRDIVTLDDMLLPGQRGAFDSALQSAWQRWHSDSEVGRTLDPDDWPFTSSDNVAPLPEGLAVRYQVYSLGPYVIGQPQLVIPWATLEGVVKPRFMAGFNR